MADKRISELPPASGALLTDEIPVNQGGVTKKVTGAQLAGIASTPAVTHVVTFVFDGQGATLAAGLVAYSPRLPYAGTIQSWAIVSADPAVTSGSCVVDLWKAPSHPPVVGNSITASAKPTLTSATSAFSTTLTSWTTTVAVGDYLAAHLDSASGVKRIEVAVTLVGTS